MKKMNEDKIDQNRHLEPWAPLGPSVVPATTSQDAPQSESGSSSCSNIINIPISKKLPSKLSEDERRRAKTSLQLLLDFTDVLGSIDRSIDRSLDWFKGKSTGNHGFYHPIWGFPVNFPIIQFYESIDLSPSSYPLDYQGAAMASQSCPLMEIKMKPQTNIEKMLKIRSKYKKHQRNMG